MTILDSIYESYLMGDLSVEPTNVWIGNRPEYAALVRDFGLNEEQAGKLQDLLLETVDGEGKNYFVAGFKLAMEMMNDVSARANADSQENGEE